MVFPSMIIETQHLTERNEGNVIYILYYCYLLTSYLQWNNAERV